MIDLDHIVGFEWDEGNVLKSADKHGVSVDEAEQMFWNEPLIVVPDPRHSDVEPRFHALGITLDRRKPHVTFTLRKNATLIRVISARPMSRSERIRYDQEI